jgi:hypothetical protein
VKVLALSDATWQNLERVLERSDEGLEVLARMTAPAPELPDRNELLVATTEPDSRVEVFDRIAERADALEAAVEQTRAQRDALIRQARAMRVSTPALARWTGLSLTHVYDVTK